MIQLYQSYPYIDINTSVNNINLGLKHLYEWLCANNVSLNIKNKLFKFSLPNSKYQIYNCITITNEIINHVNKHDKEE